MPDQFSFLSYFQFYIFFLFALMGESLRKRNYTDVNQILLLIMILMPVWMITTLRALATMIGEGGATVTRVLAKSSDEAVELTQMGVGGYGMVYFLVLYIPCMIFLFRNKNLLNYTEKWKGNAIGYLTLVNILLGLFTVYKADYVFAIFLALIGLGFSFFYDSKSIKKKVLFLVGSLSMVVIVPLLIVRFINELADFFWGTSLHRKLVDIQLSLLTGKSQGTVSDRVDRYQRSWNYYLDNPILGTLKKDNLGKHSMILDTFAQYGTFIGLFLVFVLSYIFIRYMRAGIYISNLHITMCLMTLLITLLNNIGAIQGVAIFLVYPAIQSASVLRPQQL